MQVDPAPTEAAQFLPHAPQFAGSVARFEQVPVQATVPAGHVVQLPPMHVEPVHTLPQLPQLVGSVWRLAQNADPPSGVQMLCPAAQADTQLLPWHTFNAGHTFPQAPQLLGSDVVLAHSGVPPTGKHGVCIKVHVDWHVLAVHWVSGPQASPAGLHPAPAPQWVLDEVGSMHAPLQSTSPVGQDSVHMPLAQTYPAPIVVQSIP
jgi:hypothetical protein